MRCLVPSIMSSAVAAAASARSSVVAPRSLAAGALQRPCSRARTPIRRAAHAAAAAAEPAAASPLPPPPPPGEGVWRPSLDDVQRISQGDAARHRGTGSRAVPHRLNAEERKQYDIAKAKGVLTIAGSGYRRERKGAPLANIYRQWCDARGQACVVLAKGPSAAAGDAVLVDLSVLRMPDVGEHRQACRDVAARHGVERQADSAVQSPFTVILPAPLIDAMLAAGGADGSAAAEGGAEEEDSVAAQLAELRGSAPIWQQPPQLEAFVADRGTAKALAKELAERLECFGA